MSKRKLLLADDSVTIQKVVNLTFADEGIEVITVGDGDSAMQSITEMAPDIVLADVHMPGLNGYQICELLRGNPVTKHLPVVLLVGSFEPFDEGEAERVGANAYLTKPFQSIRQLISQVSDLMESPTSSEEKAGDEAKSLHETEETPDVEAEKAAAAGATESGGGETPETTDIDYLYHRSVSPLDAESRKTTEHDNAESAEADSSESPHVPYVDVGMDDEMIVTVRADEAISETEPSEVQHETEEYEVEQGYLASQDQPAADSQGEWSGQSPFDSLATANENDAAALESRKDESYFDQFADTEQIPASQRPDLAEFELDEIELLELPPLENGKTLEFTTTQSMKTQGENKQVVSLSPELLDVIVQKVVERLSEKY